MTPPPLAVEALRRIARGLPAFEGAAAPAPKKWVWCARTERMIPPPAFADETARREAMAWLFRRGFVMRTESPMGEPRAYTRIPAVCGRRKAGAMAPGLVVPLVTDAGREFLSTQ